MKTKQIAGFLLIVGGIAMGLYCGIWWAFIGGIIAVINEIKSEEIEALAFALGICRVIFAAIIGWAVAFVLIIPGIIMIKN